MKNQGLSLPLRLITSLQKKKDIPAAGRGCEFHHDSPCIRSNSSSSSDGGIAQLGLFIASINGDKGPRISGVAQENRE